jgi:biopolymer transport protein ExbD
MTETLYINDNGKKREATDEEIAQFEKDKADYEQKLILIEAEENAKIQARQSALAKLAALGLTEEEIAAL